jgi:hypothetical protein
VKDSWATVSILATDDQDFDDADGAALREWLLDARIDGLETRAPETDVNTMGLSHDALLLLAPGSAGAALAASISHWIRARRSDLRVRIRQGEREVTLDGRNLRDVEPLVRDLLDHEKSE